MQDQLRIEYNASVMTLAGWRGVTITAKAVPVTKAMAEVVEVIEIDGETPHQHMSRTGAARQRYNGNSIAEREKGKRKRLSACKVVE